MKKVININFQGRVIPIEESAYESLKRYIESLRRYFAQEEGRDEIINDIESRIAELFSERLKKGLTSCITDEDVDSVIAGMGRPEDFEAQDAENTSTGSQQNNTRQSQATSSPAGVYRSRLFRNADDKILGGVCSGLANYLKIDPIVMRIVFVLLFGVLFWVYILLWIIVPSQSVQSNITKRLYRSADHKVIGGVCGGIAAYFNIDIWIPRLIFALPFLLALVSGGFNTFWWDWDFGFVPRIVSGSFGWTMFLTYVVLWIAVPQASTAADRLEMRGEKVDLNSIRNTVKEDLENFKTKAEKWGSEVKESAQNLGQQAKQFGQEASDQARTFAYEAGPVARRTGNGLGHAIGVLFKAFFFLIAAIVALALFGVFIGLLFGGFALAPLKDFFLEGVLQNTLAWSTLFLFFGIPLVALITWLIRRIMGARSKNHYLGYIFSTLWLIGLVSAISIVVMVSRNFRNVSRLEEEPVAITQPVNNKLYVDIQRDDWKKHHGDFFLSMDDNWPYYNIDQDSIKLNTVRVNIAKSNDSAYHVYKVRASRGSSAGKAAAAAQKIRFDIEQKDSILFLSEGFTISKEDKFRNQQVWIVVEVPVGKKIEFDGKLSRFNWFDISYGRNGIRFDDNWDDWDNNLYRPDYDVEYIMSPEGRPERVKKWNTRDNDNDDQEDEDREKAEKEKVEKEKSTPGLKSSLQSDGQPKAVSGAGDDGSIEEYGYNKKEEMESKESDNSGHTLRLSPDLSSELGTPLTVLLKLFQSGY